jgi:hypothetical protein
MTSALALFTLVSAHRLLVGLVVMLGLLLRCGQASAADEAAPPQLCPPQFVSASSGQTLEAHATACADWAPASTEGATRPDSVDDGEPVVAASPVSALTAAGAAPVPGAVAREAALAMADAQPPAAAGWRELPGLRWVGQLRVQGGGLVLHDAATQYFVKLRGIRGVRMGFKLAF